MLNKMYDGTPCQSIGTPRMVYTTEESMAGTLILYSDEAMTKEVTSTDICSEDVITNLVVVVSKTSGNFDLKEYIRATVGMVSRNINTGAVQATVVIGSEGGNQYTCGENGKVTNSGPAAPPADPVS